MRTISGIKADIGSTTGHWCPIPEVTVAVEEYVTTNGEYIGDTFQFTLGDDIHILLSHRLGENTDGVRELVWNAFEHGAEIAKQRGLYGSWDEIVDDLGDWRL